MLWDRMRCYLLVVLLCTLEIIRHAHKELDSVWCMFLQASGILVQIPLVNTVFGRIYSLLLRVYFPWGRRTSQLFAEDPDPDVGPPLS